MKKALLLLLALMLLLTAFGCKRDKGENEKTMPAKPTTVGEDELDIGEMSGDDGTLELDLETGEVISTEPAATQTPGSTTATANADKTATTAAAQEQQTGEQQEMSGYSPWQ